MRASGVHGLLSIARIERKLALRVLQPTGEGGPLPALNWSDPCPSDNACDRPPPARRRAVLSRLKENRTTQLIAL
jgi:hypothetical protein